MEISEHINKAIYDAYNVQENINRFADNEVVANREILVDVLMVGFSAVVTFVLLALCFTFLHAPLFVIAAIFLCVFAKSFWNLFVSVSDRYKKSMSLKRSTSQKLRHLAEAHHLCMSGDTSGGIRYLNSISGRSVDMPTMDQLDELIRREEEGGFL